MIKNPSGYHDKRNEPPKKSNAINGLQVRKTGSSTPFNVLGGHRWPNSVDSLVLQKIVRAELGCRKVQPEWISIALSQLNSAKEAA